MKKTAYLLLIIALLLCACGKKTPQTPADTATTESTQAPTVEVTLPTQTEEATEEPTVAPTTKATKAPTTKATKAPTTKATEAPTTKATEAPTTAPSVAPTTAPSVAPTTAPSVAPTTAPTTAPTVASTTAPSVAPSVAPTTAPSVAPTADPTDPTECTHNWKQATCTDPKTCENCQATEGSVLPHDYQNGSCTMCERRRLDYGTWTAVIEPESEFLYKPAVREIFLVFGEHEGYAAFDLSDYLETNTGIDKTITYNEKQYYYMASESSRIYYKIEDDIIICRENIAENSNILLVFKKIADDKIMVISSSGFAANHYQAKAGTVFTYTPAEPQA